MTMQRPASSSSQVESRDTLLDRAVATCCAILLISLASPAQAAASLNLMDLQVYAKTSIEAARSDYEGTTAAGTTIVLRDFQIDGDLTSGQRIAFERGKVGGFVSSPATTLTDVFSSGRGASVDRALDLASVKLDLLASRLSALPATTRASFGSDDTGGKTIAVATVSGTNDLEVVDLPGDRLISEGPGQMSLALDGSRSSRLLVRVHGRSVRIRDVGFTVRGGLDPSRIVLLFPEADDLEIALSGGASSESGTAWGIPASVVAPHANLRFAAATVTGQVFVKSISAIADLPSGQVDRFSSEAASDRASGSTIASEILRMADDEGFEGNHPLEHPYHATWARPANGRDTAWMPWSQPAPASAANQCQVVCP